MEVTPAEEVPAPPMGSGSPDIISKFIEVSLSGTFVPEIARAYKSDRKKHDETAKVRRGPPPPGAAARRGAAAMPSRTRRRSRSRQ